MITVTIRAKAAAGAAADEAKHSVKYIIASGKYTLGRSGGGGADPHLVVPGEVRASVEMSCPSYTISTFVLMHC